VECTRLCGRCLASIRPRRVRRKRLNQADFSKM
jgi:hypothetical protein